MGFAIGSERDTQGKPLIEVMHLIEYASIDPENRLVRICADVIMENTSDKPARLFLLHPGNVELYASTGSWENDQIWTPALTRIAARDIGLRQGEDGLYLNSPGRDTIRIDLLTGPESPLEEWRTNRQDDKTFADITGILSPQLEPGKGYLFRVAGVVDGESYRCFDPVYREGCIGIVAGEPMMYGLPKGSGGFQDMFIHPDYHHFLIEMADGSPLKKDSSSTDIRQQGENVQIDGRKVSWWWSDAELVTCYRTGGPWMEIAKQMPDELRKVRRHKRMLQLV